MILKQPVLLILAIVLFIAAYLVLEAKEENAQFEQEKKNVQDNLQRRADQQFQQGENEAFQNP